MGGVLGKGTKSTKNFFFKITDVLDQMIRSTSILHINLFLKKNKIWFLFPALTPYLHLLYLRIFWVHTLPFLYAESCFVMQIFVPANLKYSDVLLESYFFISHIARRAYLYYTLTNLYSLYIVADGGHFADTVIVRQIFLVLTHLYDFAFSLSYLTFY